MFSLLASFAFAGDPAPTTPVTATPPAVDPCIVVAPATPATPAADANLVPVTPTPPAPPVVGTTPPANCPTATAPVETPKRKGLTKSNDNRMEAEATDE